MAMKCSYIPILVSTTGICIDFILHIIPFGFQRNDFFNMGVYCVLSIIYGGKGYPFLAEPVFAYLATGQYSIMIPEADIPDALLKSVVVKVC